MDPRNLWQKDSEYWRVYLDAKRLQAACEMAGMETQAAQAREIRAQAFLRLVAMHAADLQRKPDDRAA